MWWHRRTPIGEFIVGDAVVDPGTSASAGSFAATAAAGGFAVSPQVGAAMSSAITAALDRVDQAALHLERIKQGTPLGESPAGLVMAEHNLSVAAGASGHTGEQTLVDLRLALEEHHAAIDAAIAHYREQDQLGAGLFR